MNNIHFFIPLEISGEGWQVFLAIAILGLIAAIIFCCCVAFDTPPSCPYCGSEDTIVCNTEIVWTKDGLIDQKATSAKEKYNEEHGRMKCYDCGEYFFKGAE